MRPQSLLFLHIPKTAGTTMRGIIGRQYTTGELYLIGEDVIGSIVRFRQRPESQWADTRVLQGHMSFGLHRFMTPPFGYITLLRKPMSRAVSDYAFVTSTPQHPLYQSVKDMSFAEYMSSGATGQLSNGQTRLLCGDCEGENYGVPTKRPLDQPDLDMALKNLENHVLVAGLQERFDESLVLLKRRLGWKLPFYFRENVTRRTLSGDEIGSAGRELATSQNRLDESLYARVECKFDEALREEGDAFRRELATFRVLNRMFRGAVRVRARMPSAVRKVMRRPRRSR